MSYTPETDSGTIFEQAVIFRNNRRAFFGETLGSEEMRIFSAAIDDVMAQADPKKQLSLRVIVDNEYLRLRSSPGYNIPAAILESVTRYEDGLKVDLSVLPEGWRRRYERAVAAVRAYDIPRRGYAGIYRNIEFISNTAKLSHNQRALAMGLDKISENTPAALFDEIGDKFGIRRFPIPEKRFFDAFGSSYVPLYLVPSGQWQAWYDEVWRCVMISDNKELADWLRGSAQARLSLIYHEYGHAYDYANKIWQSKSFNKFLNWFDGEIKKFSDDDIYQYFENWSKVLDGYTAERRANKLEVIGAIADSVQSRTSSHRFLDSCGHPEDYFISGDDHTRVTEIIANFNALYWTKAALPREKGYRKLREMIEELFAGIYP